EDSPAGGGGQANPHPDRPGEPYCSFCLKTGLCTYGRKCKYNHPTITGLVSQHGDQFPQRDGQPECQFFLETGNCKFGGTYKYHHPHDKNEAQSLQLNILGLPIPKDEKSCPYYMKTGSSKFGVACKFNHPQPTNVGTMFPVQEPSVYGYTGSCASAIALSLAGGLSGWPLSTNSSMSSSKMNGFPAYMPLILPPTEATMPMHWGWSTYMDSLSSIPSNRTLRPNHRANTKHHAQLGSSMAVSLPERADQIRMPIYHENRWLLQIW
ncbi:hypothetical protein B296_00038965, partial [Ensete ventricosum]